MAIDPLDLVRMQIGNRVAELHQHSLQLSPIDMHCRMNEIGAIAAANGLSAIESLARSSAQRALLPGHRVALHCCLERFDDALDSASPGDCQTILAALAVRLH
jgi:hypothetical protein